MGHSLHPHSPDADIDDGLVFRHRTSLNVWGILAAVGFAVNFAIYGAKRLDVAMIDGPTRAEHTTLGIYLTTHALLYAAAMLALFVGSRRHPQKMLTPWMLLGAVVAIHLLAGVPALVAGAGADGGGEASVLLLLNPLTYVVAVPVVALFSDLSMWRNKGALGAGTVLLAAVVFPLLFVGFVV